jgi:hypothetical protein
MSKNSYSWAKRYEFPAQTKQEAAAYLADGIKTYGRKIIYGNAVDALILKGSFSEYALANDIPFDEEQVLRDLKEQYQYRHRYDDSTPWETSDFC